MGDNIKAPNYYCEGREYEPKDVIRDWGLNFDLGSAVKYISRAGRKGDKLEDLQKAKQFLEFEIEALAEREDLKHIVQKIDRGEIDCNVIPSELYSSYKDIRDAVERRTSWYTNGVLGHWYYYQNIPDGYKTRVIDRIVEMVRNGELDLMDIPNDLYDECVRSLADIANSDYRKALDGIKKYAEDTEDTVSIKFEFEVDPDIDTDTVNVHVYIKNKED